MDSNTIPDPLAAGGLGRAAQDLDNAATRLIGLIDLLPRYQQRSVNALIRNLNDANARLLGYADRLT